MTKIWVVPRDDAVFFGFTKSFGVKRGSKSYVHAIAFHGRGQEMRPSISKLTWQSRRITFGEQVAGPFPATLPFSLVLTSVTPGLFIAFEFHLLVTSLFKSSTVTVAS
jgi:hypothetical protein